MKISNNQIKVSKTIYPNDKPPFNEWCNQFRVSSMYIPQHNSYATLQDSKVNNFFKKLVLQISK